MTIFVEGDYIVNANVSDRFLYGDHWSNAPYFCVKNSNDKHQKFTVNSDGTVSLKENPRYVLGTDYRHKEVQWV